MDIKIPEKIFFPRLAPFLLITFLLLSCYSNSFNAGWHMDDKPNILDNIHLHINSLSPNHLANTFYTNPKSPNQLGSSPYRPVACLTFALNWYFGKDDVFGYHLVNISVHIFTAFFLVFFFSPFFQNYQL